MSHTFTRQELYEKVWSEPLSTLAPKYGISDVAMAKACKKVGIPRPDRGYWAKKKAGKPAIKVVLGERFPGADDTVKIGGNRYSHGAPVTLNSPDPIPPVFHEEIEALKLRIQKIVGKVAFPRTDTKTHPLIQKLLDQDEERRKEQYSWHQPLFNSQLEKRRLRILNAIFLATQKTGGKPHISTSKYNDDISEPSIQVGDQYVHILLKIINNNQKSRKDKNTKKEKLSFSINRFSTKQGERESWTDTEDLRVEKELTAIVNEILLAGELQHRESAWHHYKWQIERKAELLEEERQRKIDEERKARELKERKEKERIDRLLSEATSLQQAETIRSYVAAIRNNADKIKAPTKDIEDWSSWALAQADRIDPIKSLSFLSHQNIDS